MMETMILPQVEMRLRTKNKGGGGQISAPSIQKKLRENDRRDFVTTFYHTCASKWHHAPHVESLMIYHFHMLVGMTCSFYKLGLYIPMTGFLKRLRSS